MATRSSWWASAALRFAPAPGTGRNPKTKEAITIPASKAPVFKAGKALKDSIQ